MHRTPLHHTRVLVLTVILQFPYALEALPSTLATRWDTPEFAPYRDAFPAEHRRSPSALEAHVRDLMGQDVKIPYLKSLQGYLWLQGYESGALRCPLFADVAPAMRAWHDAGLTIVIYSSGSVAAQKLLFKYTSSTPEPDLRPLLSGHFDTVNAGMKTETQSYVKIARQFPAVQSAQWLFLSDNVLEVAAAVEAGMQSAVVKREGNAPLTAEDEARYTVVTSFEAVVEA